MPRTLSILTPVIRSPILHFLLVSLLLGGCTPPGPDDGVITNPPPPPITNPPPGPTPPPPPEPSPPPPPGPTPPPPPEPSPPPPPGPTPPPPGEETINGYVVDGYMVTVELKASDTPEALEAQYQAKVEIWDSEADAPNAVLRLNQKPADPQAAGAWPNLRQYSSGAKRAWMSGSSAWAEGSSAWAEGSSAWAEGKYTPIPENTATWNQIGLLDAHLEAPRMGLGVKVAILDSGIDLAHHVFAGVLAPAEEMWDFVGKDAVPQEEGAIGDPGFGHGTNVAGIVRQVAPKATLLPIRVLGQDGSGNIVNIVRAIRWAVAKGANVINMSLGTNEYSAMVEKAVVFATSKGVMVVMSAGNDGLDQALYPAKESYEELRPQDPRQIMRTSVGSIDGQDNVSTFSNRNSASDNYANQVEVAAPGEMIYGPAPGNLKVAWSGTSMAAPIITGTLALALSEADRFDKDVSKETLLGELEFNADPVGNGPAGIMGKGRLNMVRFLQRVLK